MTKAITYTACLVVFSLGLLPFLHFLIFGLRERRREILSYFEDESIQLYFKQFYLAELPRLSGNAKKSLRDIYDDRFGYRTFVLPGVLYVMSLALIVACVVSSLPDDPAGWSGPKLESRGIYALAGAYMWVVWDLISRYRQRDVVPSVLYWYAFRFVISIPLAYALSTLLNEAAAPPVAFLLGAFPTNTLMLIVRRQGAQRFGLGDDTGATKLELEKLQGVNTTLAEKLSEVGVTTMLQLAYEDPIQLTMRTNLSFQFITDIISQALATVYGLDLGVTRLFSVRGAIEAAEVYEDLSSKKKAEQARAEAVVQKLAEALKVPTEIVAKILHDIRNDPFTDFVRNIWN
jgi:hypothetical protein